MATVHLPSALPAANRLLDVQAVSEKLKCSVRHVYRMADAAKMPAPIRLGNLVRWSESKIEQWIADGCPSLRSATAKHGVQ